MSEQDLMYVNQFVEVDEIIATTLSENDTLLDEATDYVQFIIDNL